MAVPGGERAAHLAELEQQHRGAALYEPYAKFDIIRSSFGGPPPALWGANDGPAGAIHRRGRPQKMTVHSREVTTA
jgi:hypothetical protein